MLEVASLIRPHSPKKRLSIHPHERRTKVVEISLAVRKSSEVLGSFELDDRKVSG